MALRRNRMFVPLVVGGAGRIRLTFAIRHMMEQAIDR